MDALELDVLAERIGKVERQNGRLRLWLTALGLGFGALAIAGAAPPLPQVAGVALDWCGA